MPIMTSIDWQHLTDEITLWGKELGFSAIGISDIELNAHQQKLDAWLAKEYHGEMDYMARHGDLRSHPEKLHTGTVSVITFRLDYLEKEPNPKDLLTSDGHAYISRYALGRDYHKVIRGKLKKLVTRMEDYLVAYDFNGFSSRVFTDSAPILEKALAEKAGLGWIGKNTLLINERAGSWFFLAEILTNLPLPVTPDAQQNRCGSCTACIDICPTNAIVAPYQLDARRCISYLTIEHRGSIPEPFRAAMGNRVFGCDDCQIACPWNRYAQDNAEPDFSPRHGLDSAQLLDLFCWSEDEFLKKTEGSPIRRTGYLGWLRNLAVGLGNSPAQAGLTAALNQKKGISDLTDEHIDWALNQPR
ncbi:MAG: tRNA epoxyqueuosine(34) reductase QueG [Gammaproteobacteria bacterium]|jgi:epoxyqueuosine reductase|nr:tRNA epoxyqueuosine(34) reductase QueG [Gammaproteobacteria bacterium]MBT4494020.1 tRNA epoxyqueuosine(34) reductase QueG [Gammaproteobacteria bacterium]